ncbi:hypothetical protein OG884_26635 [Streptosporangium sp. NBC_01755]|uniref:hypothetical protein n=1 Tax=Streptosporangium sp. NBC_01755 TaxID=2975949 RepID=UPI002DD9CEAF|nr:hypothetical protein [Streptosporangium sp. NBC_01755]WSC98427.1 hypothetical protein OG884_26635 [Streptosporangium sp. NBC_01755]
MTFDDIRSDWAFPDDVAQCSRCVALVLAVNSSAHEAWHEQMRTASPESPAEVFDKVIAKLEMQRVTSDWPRTSQQATGYKQGMYDAIATLKQVRELLVGGDQ